MGGAFDFAVAGPGDEAELRRLLRDNPMPGAVSLTLEREPDFFRGAAIEGSPHQTFIARERATGRVVALASRSLREVWLNGEPRSLGYLSQARIDRRFRGRRSLLLGMARQARALHADGAAPFYYTTIIADNRLARRLFEGEWGEKPSYRPCGTVSTLTLPLWRVRAVRLPRGAVIRPAVETDRAGLSACLQRNLARYQLAPVWRPEALGDPQRTPGLALGDFLVVEDGGRLVACLALWDQRGFKQAVVRGWAGWLGASRPVINAAARLARAPSLPAPGEALGSVFLSHLAVDGDRAEWAVALVAAACNRLRRRGIGFATLGLAAGHPLLVPVSRAFLHLTYRSVLYAVAWPDGAAEVAALDGRLPHVEVATL